MLLALVAITECMKKGGLLNKMVLSGRKQDSCWRLYFMVLCTNDSSVSSVVVEWGHMSTRKNVTNEKFIILERDNKMFVIYSSAGKKTQVRDCSGVISTVIVLQILSEKILQIIFSLEFYTYVILQISLFGQIADCVCLKRGNCLCSLCYFYQLLPLGSVLRMFIILRLVKKKILFFKKKVGRPEGMTVHSKTWK